MKNAHRKAERKIRRIPPSSESGSEVALDEQIPTAADAAVDQEPATQRLSMPVMSDGRIDVTRLREKSKSALRQALSDPALPVALGITSGDSPTVDSAENAALLKDITHNLFTGVSALSVALAMRSGFPVHAARVMIWDEKEINTIAPLTGKIAQKRLLPLLGEEYRDEILLSYQVLSIIGAKIILLREAAKHPPQTEPVSETA